MFIVSTYLPTRKYTHIELINKVQLLMHYNFCITFSVVRFLFYLPGEYVNPFHAFCLFLHPLKTSENLLFSDVFRRYRKRSVVLNGLIPWANTTPKPNVTWNGLTRMQLKEYTHQCWDADQIIVPGGKVANNSYCF